MMHDFMFGSAKKALKKKSKLSEFYFTLFVVLFLRKQAVFIGYSICAYPYICAAAGLSVQRA